MALEIEECPTGILIDFVGDTSASNSRQCNEKEQEAISNGLAPKVESSHDKEEISGSQTPFVNIDSRSNLTNNCLGEELNKNAERDAWSGWRTPSPTAMNRISEEALRIVDQLDTSLDRSIWDEEFPLGSTIEDSGEYYKSEVLPRNVLTNALNCNTLSGNVTKKDMLIKKELSAKCLSPSQENLNSKTENIITKETSLVSPNVLRGNFNVTEKSSDVNKNLGSDNSTIAEKSSCLLKESIDKAEESSVAVEISSRTVEGNSGSVKRSSNNTSKGSDVYEKTSVISNESTGTSKQIPCLKEHCSDDCATNANCETCKGNCATVKENSDILEESSCPFKESSETPKASCETLKASCEIPKASCEIPKASCEIPKASSETPKTSSKTTKASSETPEASCDTPEASYETLEARCETRKTSCETPEASSDTPQPSPGAFDKSSGELEKNCSGTTEKYPNVSDEKFCDKQVIKAVAIGESCLVSEENCVVTKESVMVREDIKAITVSSSMRTKCPKVGNSKSITYMEQRHLSSESIIDENSIRSLPSKPLNMKSKFSKDFIGSVLKTPNNHNKDKENIFQASKEKNTLSEKRISEVKPFSSVKSVLGESNANRSKISTSKPNIPTPLSKRILGKIPFIGRENKSNMNMLQDQTKETIKQLNTPLKKKNLFQFPPTSSIKTPLYKSNSVDTPNLVKPVRRANSFQTRPSIETPKPIKREKSFAAVSHLKTLNSRMSLYQPSGIGSELKTPSKCSSFLQKRASNTFATPLSSNIKSCAKTSHVAGPSFGSALKPINTANPIGKHMFDFKRPASTTSKTRFTSRLELPSTLPKAINDSIPRQLFPDSTPKKRFN